MLPPVLQAVPRLVGRQRLVLFEATDSFQGLLVCQRDGGPASRGLLDRRGMPGLRGVLQLLLLRELLKLRNGRCRPCKGKRHLMLMRRTLLLHVLCLRLLRLHLLKHLVLQLLLVALLQQKELVLLGRLFCCCVNCCCTRCSDA